MTESAFDIDAALQCAATAREEGDRAGEALALTVLGQALHEAERDDEAHHFHAQAAELTQRKEDLLPQADALLARGYDLEKVADHEALWHELLVLDMRRDGMLAGRTWPGEFSSGYRDWEAEAVRRKGELRARRVRYISRYESAQHAYAQAGRILHVAGETYAGDVAERRAQRLDVDREWRLNPPSQAMGTNPYQIELLAAGYVAVKLVGPFLEAFATKLGERLGESTASALGRIKVIRGGRAGFRGIEIKPPDSQGTLLVLPEVLSDQAKLCIIDLDVTSPELRGATLHWDEATRTWRAPERPEST